MLPDNLLLNMLKCNCQISSEKPLFCEETSYDSQLKEELVCFVVMQASILFFKWWISIVE